MSPTKVPAKTLIPDKKLRNLKYYQNKAIDFSRRNRLLKFPNGKATFVGFDLPFEECNDFFGSISELKLELPHKQILKQDDVEETNQNDAKEKTNNKEEIPLPPINYKGKK